MTISWENKTIHIVKTLVKVKDHVKLSSANTIHRVKEEKDDVSIKSKSMLTSSLSENKKRTSDDFLGEQNNTRSQNISKRPRQVK